MNCPICGASDPADECWNEGEYCPLIDDDDNGPGDQKEPIELPEYFPV